MRRALALSIVLAGGCNAQAPMRAPPRELFPTGAFDDKVALGACPLQVQTFRTVRNETSPTSTPTVGGHPRHTLVDLRERSQDVEVIALEIDAYPSGADRPPSDPEAPDAGEDSEHFDNDAVSWRYPSYSDRLVSAVATEDPLHDMSVWLNGSPELRVRVLLRRKVGGGLFDSLSHCFEGYATTVAGPNTSYARVVIDTPSDGSNQWVSLELY
ncbi:MAG: hypothetical protein HOV80_29520 [Polyangiaceae bacterium]|nr:hypothetical protein [Polyangiaceae bacterium]